MSQCYSWNHNLNLMTNNQSNSCYLVVRDWLLSSEGVSWVELFFPAHLLKLWLAVGLNETPFLLPSTRLFHQLEHLKIIFIILRLFFSLPLFIARFSAWVARGSSSRLSRHTSSSPSFFISFISFGWSLKWFYLKYSIQSKFSMWTTRRNALLFNQTSPEMAIYLDNVTVLLNLLGLTQPPAKVFPEYMFVDFTLASTCRQLKTTPLMFVAKCSIKDKKSEI